MGELEGNIRSISPVRVNHLNAVVEDFDKSIEHFRRVYDAEVLMDLPQENWHAAVLSVGRVLFELFAPADFFLHSRHGPHYFGVEYQSDLDVARQVVAARGMRIGRDIKAAIHTDPRDGFGISFEFYSGEFQTLEYPLLGGRMQPPEHWREVHALGITGLAGYTVVSANLAASEQFFKAFLSAKSVTRSDRPGIGACSSILRVADAFVDILSPSDEGFLQRHLETLGPGIFSTVFGVASIERARAHFARHEINLVPGTADGRWATEAKDNCGLIFEFSEDTEGSEPPCN